MFVLYKPQRYRYPPVLCQITDFLGHSAQSLSVPNGKKYPHGWRSQGNKDALGRLGFTVEARIRCSALRSHKRPVYMFAAFNNI